MTTELEKQFYKTFGIEPKIYKTDGRDIDDNGDVCSWYIEEVYHEISDRKLLQLLCIYNDMQNCIDLCITPCKYEDTKEMILQTLIDEKTNITDYEEGTYMDVMTKQIQQLFKGEE